MTWREASDSNCNHEWLGKKRCNPSVPFSSVQFMMSLFVISVRKRHPGRPFGWDWGFRLCKVQGKPCIQHLAIVLGSKSGLPKEIGVYRVHRSLKIAVHICSFQTLKVFFSMFWTNVPMVSHSFPSWFPIDKAVFCRVYPSSHRGIPLVGHRYPTTNPALAPRLQWKALLPIRLADVSHALVLGFPLLAADGCTYCLLLSYFIGYTVIRQ
jgi:hypothetical protein